MKAVQLLVNHYLPEDLRNYDQVYDTKSVNKILNAVAKKHPDKFAEVSKKIADIGRNASYRQGETITLADFVPVIDKEAIYAKMDAEIAQLPRDSSFKQKRREIFQKYNNLIERETSKAALAKRNNIAMAVLSGARGKPAQLKAMNATPGTYSDYKGEPIDVWSRESFAEGIRPSSWLASTFGSRASVVSTKSSTAKGGDWSKQAAAVAADLVVRKENCGSHNGLAMPIDEPSLKGRSLAQETDGIPAGTFITKDVLQKFRKDGVKNVIARSPITCNVPNGLCAYCVGKFYNGGKLPKIGDSIGLLASSTVGEPVTQMALSAKHTAGMTKDKKNFSGLEVIQQFSQSPETFKDRAAVSELDGVVESIKDAPQGGKYVIVNGEKHYVLPGHEVLVKEGEQVEAGDQLADGLVDPEDVVRLKGLGEGRLYYANRLNQILVDSGAGTDKRNTEVLARAALRHVKITDPEGMGPYLPDDLADYNAVQTSYRVPDTARTLRPKEAIGKYLQQPIMHYTIGTRITPKVAKALAESNFNDVIVDDNAPSFEPQMVRLRAASHTNPDWLASMGTSYLSKQLNESATRGDDTNIQENDDFRPRLAVGVGFGSNVGKTGKF